MKLGVLTVPLQGMETEQAFAYLSSLGVQTVDIDTVRRALFEGADPINATWGLHDLPHSGGYVVVG